MAAARMLTVHAFWDDEARVWVATSDDVEGLATEACDLERLVDKLTGMIPDLLDANRIFSGAEIPFEIVVRRFATAQGSATNA